MSFVPILIRQFDEDILAPRRTRRPRSRAGLKPAPTSFAPFGLFAVRFFLLRDLPALRGDICFSSSISARRIMLLTRLSTPVSSRTNFSLSCSLEEVPAVAISTPVDVCCDTFRH